MTQFSGGQQRGWGLAKIELEDEQGYWQALDTWLHQHRLYLPPGWYANTPKTNLVAEENN